MAAIFYFVLSFIMAWISRKVDLRLRAKVER
jgi:ABC-type amino acid transport system permease subunit